MSGPRDEAPLDAFDERLLDALYQAAASLTGFSREAIRPEALRQSARTLLSLWPPEELLSRIHLRDEQVSRALHLAVSVGETFFFRQPEHFEFIRGTLAPAWLASGARRIRAWSAGCATGEEAFSLAAFLLETLAGSSPLELDILGTDLLPRNLAIARAATYGAWSQRASAALLAPLLRPTTENSTGPQPLRILERVRQVVRFQEHNLLEPLAEAQPFELILCRNVLVYFAPEAARRAIANLSYALAPGGVLMLGSMDLNVAAPALEREGPPEALIFRKPLGASAGRLSQPPQPRTSQPRSTPPAEPSPRSTTLPGASLRTQPGRDLTPAPRPPAPRPPEPVALHLRALGQIDAGQHEAAEQSLRALLAGSPGYLPGLFERALLHARRGEPAAAAALMREVQRRASLLALDEPVPGPEPLPARFYLESAAAFLRGGRG